MKKKSFFIFVCMFAYLSIMTVKSQTVYPYFPPESVLADLTGTATTVADPSTHTISLSKDFTYEVSGTSATPVRLSNGIYYYEYTPAATGIVRFVKKSGVVYVYEGAIYKGTVAKINAETTYPTITDTDASTNPAQLLQNASFETNGGLVGGTNYKFGTPWLTNVTVGTSGGIRISDATSGNVNGTFECVWRGSGNDNYFAQQVTGIKPNTNYQLIVKQIATGNANADFNVGFGSTVNGLEFGTSKIRLGTSPYDGTKSVTISTNESVTGTVYFTFRNTNPNTASSGTDPVTQMDYLALVEGTTTMPTGVTGVTGSAKYVDGTAYAPEVTLAEGDYFDMTSFIVNPGFSNGSTGWISTAAAQNKGTATNQNVGAFSGTMPFWEHWNGSPFTGKMYQIVNNLPAGQYRLKMGVFANNGGEGLFVYGNDAETAVANAATPSFFTVDFIAAGSAEIGLNIKSGTNNWLGIDNVSLMYFGPVSTPLTSVSVTNLLLTEATLSKTFTLTGTNLTGDVSIVSNIPGVTLEPATVSKSDSQLASGKTITVVFDPAAAGAGSLTGTITVSSTDVENKVIALATSKDAGCFTASYPNNLAPDPLFLDVAKMLGWGARQLIIDPNLAYCGAGVGFSNGGSYDQRILWKANTSYVVKAQINANTTEVQLGVYGIGKGDVTKKPADKTKWELVDFGFTSGESPTTTGGVFFNGAGATGAYIDNLEVYEAWKITFNSNGGSDVPVQYAVKDQKAIAPTAPAKENFNFMGWYSDEGLTTLWQFDTGLVTADITLFAKWEDVGTGVSLAIENEEVIKTEYFNIQGQMIKYPVINNVYLVRKTYASQNTKVVKEIYRVK